MIVKTIFSGFGGQGVLMMGYTFAHGAMNQAFEVTYLPAYGAEIRGARRTVRSPYPMKRSHHPLHRSLIM